MACATLLSVVSAMIQPSPSTPAGPAPPAIAAARATSDRPCTAAVTIGGQQQHARRHRSRARSRGQHQRADDGARAHRAEQHAVEAGVAARASGAPPAAAAPTPRWRTSEEVPPRAAAPHAAPGWRGCRRSPARKAPKKFSDELRCPPPPGRFHHEQRRDDEHIAQHVEPIGGRRAEARRE